MTKPEADRMFAEHVMPYVVGQYEQDGIPDYPARSQAWNDWTDSLCKDGLITGRQYNDWLAPAICSRPSVSSP